MFRDELEFFIANQDDLVGKYRGKTLVIRGHAVVAVHENVLQAYLQAQKDYEIGTFMIQRCEPGPEAYTVTASPNAVFSQ